MTKPTKPTDTVTVTYNGEDITIKRPTVSKACALHVLATDLSFAGLMGIAEAFAADTHFRAKMDEHATLKDKLEYYAFMLEVKRIAARAIERDMKRTKAIKKAAIKRRKAERKVEAAYGYGTKGGAK